MASPARDSMSEETRCWGSLPSDALAYIINECGLAQNDVAAIRLVCVHWRSTTNSHLKSLAPACTSLEQVAGIAVRFPYLTNCDLTRCDTRLVGHASLCRDASARLSTLLGALARMPSLTSLHISDTFSERMGQKHWASLVCAQALFDVSQPPAGAAAPPPAAAVGAPAAVGEAAAPGPAEQQLQPAAAQEPVMGSQGTPPAAAGPMITPPGAATAASLGSAVWAGDAAAAAAAADVMTPIRTATSTPLAAEVESEPAAVAAVAAVVAEGGSTGPVTPAVTEAAPVKASPHEAADVGPLVVALALIGPATSPSTPTFAVETAEAAAVGGRQCPGCPAGATSGAASPARGSVVRGEDAGDLGSGGAASPGRRLSFGDPKTCGAQQVEEAKVGQTDKQQQQKEEEEEEEGASVGVAREVAEPAAAPRHPPLAGGTSTSCPATTTTTTTTASVTITAPSTPGVNRADPAAPTAVETTTPITPPNEVAVATASAVASAAATTTVVPVPTAHPSETSSSTSPSPAAAAPSQPPPPLAPPTPPPPPPPGPAPPPLELSAAELADPGIKSFARAIARPGATHQHAFWLPDWCGRLAGLQELHVRGRQRPSSGLPPCLLWLHAGRTAPHLTSLSLVRLSLVTLPEQLQHLAGLTRLVAQDCSLSLVPRGVCSGLSRLEYLDLSLNGLTSLPSDFTQLTALRHLDLQRNKLAALPPDIGRLAPITCLLLNNNQLRALPPSLSCLRAVEELSCSYNWLGGMAAALPLLCSLPRLRRLELACVSDVRCRLVPPQELRLLAPNLTHLDLAANNLVPGDVLGCLTSLRSLVLSDCGLLAVPPWVRRLAPCLQRLDLSNNSLSELPPWLSACTRLRYLSIAHNRLSLRVPPSVLEQMPQLEVVESE